jgi:hypothetical protein
MLRFTCLERAPVCVQPFELGQQRWMNVQHPSGEAVDERGAENPHEACEDDQAGLMCSDGITEGRIEGFPPGVRFRVDMLRWDGCQAGTLETARIRPVAQHGDDRVRRRRSVAGIDERL